MSGMPRRARVVTWNGKDVPPELRDLPAGRYVVEAVEDEAPALSPEEETGIEAALESYRQGRVVDAKRAREIIDAALGRWRSPTPFGCCGAELGRSAVSNLPPAPSRRIADRAGFPSGAATHNQLVGAANQAPGVSPGIVNWQPQRRMCYSLSRDTS